MGSRRRAIFTLVSLGNPFFGRGDIFLLRTSLGLDRLSNRRLFIVKVLPHLLEQFTDPHPLIPPWSEVLSISNALVRHGLGRMYIVVKAASLLRLRPIRLCFLQPMSNGEVVGCIRGAVGAIEVMMTYGGFLKPIQ